MKYIIANDQSVLGDIDALDEIVMFPRSSVLSIDLSSNSGTDLTAQSTANVDSIVILSIGHASADSPTGDRAQRQMIDDLVRIINMDKHSRGYNVVFDALNNISIPNATTLNVTEQ